MTASRALEELLREHRFDSVGMICACGVECGVKCDALTREQHLAQVIEEAVRHGFPQTTYEMDFPDDAHQAVDELRIMIDISNEMQYGSLSAATVHDYLNRITASLAKWPEKERAAKAEGWNEGRRTRWHLRATNPHDAEAGQA